MWRTGELDKALSRAVVVTDSSASLPPELVEFFGIRIAPQWVVIDGTPYRDGEIDCSALWERQSLGSKITTAQPTPEDIVNIFGSVAPVADIILIATVASRCAQDVGGKEQSRVLPMAHVDLVCSGYPPSRSLLMCS